MMRGSDLFLLGIRYLPTTREAWHNILKNLIIEHYLYRAYTDFDVLSSREALLWRGVVNLHKEIIFLWRLLKNTYLFA